MRKEGHDGVILKAMRPYNNGLGHITKMVTMPIYDQSIYNCRTRRSMILKLGMAHQGLNVYKVYINDDPG